MIARPRGKPIHYLANVSLWIWLLIGGGALLFIGIAMALGLLYPETPANQLMTWWNGWLFLVPVGMACAGVYISLRWWRCPNCKRPLSTKGALPERCPQCGNALRQN